LDQANRQNCLAQIRVHVAGTLNNRSKICPNTFRLVVDTFNKAQSLIDYFDLFKPQTVKLFVGYIRYKRIYNLWLTYPRNLNKILPAIYKANQLNKKLIKRYSPNHMKTKVRFEKQAE
jgi:hypothetical protein